jgi:hypothetical protein
LRILDAVRLLTDHHDTAQRAFQCDHRARSTLASGGTRLPPFAYRFPAETEDQGPGAPRGIGG